MGDTQRFVWAVSGMPEPANEVIRHLLPAPIGYRVAANDAETWTALVKHLRERYPVARSASSAAKQAAEWCFQWAEDCQYGSAAHSMFHDGLTWQDVSYLLEHDPVARAAAEAVWA